MPTTLRRLLWPVYVPSITYAAGTAALVRQAHPGLTARQVIARIEGTAIPAAGGHDHAIEIVEQLKTLDGVELGKVSDRTFLAHLGGKLTVESKVPIRHRDDLSMVYTPGVARVVKAIAENPEDADIVAQIKELIDTRVRPAVANDGGDIVYRGFDKGKVFLRMQGACAGCPSSSATLKNGIEQLLRYYVPEVTEVRAV